MFEYELQEPVNAVYALLPMVSDQGAPCLEVAGQQTQLQGVQMGNSKRVLELLCVVPGASAS